MGNISIVISVAPAIGPTISGLILSVLDWRWMFLLVLPIALGALALGAWKIANVTQPSSASIDIPSVPLAALGFGSFVFGLSGLGEAATHPPAISPWVPLVAGAVIILVFVLRQLRLQKQERALLDMRTLAIPAFTIPAVMMAILMMSMFGVFILLPIFLQNVVELTTLQTGLLLLPGGLIMGLCAQGGEPLRHAWATQTRGAWRDPLQHGDVAADILIHSDTPVLLLLAAHVVLSIGLALMFTPLFTASLGSLPPRPLFARQRDDRDDAAGGGRRRDRAFRRDHDHAEQRSHAFRRRIGRGHCGRHPRCLPLRSHHLAGRNFGGLLHPKAEGGRRKAEEGDTPRAH